MTRPSSRAGLLFLVSVLALVAVAVGDLAFLSEAQRSGYDHGGVYVTDERAVVAKSVVMRPGDRLVLAPNLPGGGWPTFDRYGFHVVNGGDRFALLEGEAPRATYLRIENMSLQGCCPNGWTWWDRPDDAFAHRPPRAPVPTGPGLDPPMRELETSVLDRPERIDLVWVLEYAAGAARPASERERTEVENDLEAALARFGGFHPATRPGHPTVYEASLVALQPYAYGTMAALALLAAGSALAWTLRLRDVRPEADGPGTESLLRLYDAAGVYLASLRDLLVGGLLVVLGVALHVALLGAPETQYHLLRFAGVGEGARAALGLALILLYSTVVVVWAYAGWSVHRALRRWRRRRASAPLDLADAPSSD